MTELHTMLNELPFAPKTTVEDPTAGRGNTFPEGLWQGTVQAIRRRIVVEGDPGDFLLNFFDDGSAEEVELLSIQIGEAQGLVEGQDNPGNLVVFDDNIYMSIDGIKWTDPDLSSDSDPKFKRLLTTRRKLYNFAFALGEFEEDDSGNRRPTADFITGLEGEDLVGRTVSFETTHRAWTNKAGTKSGIDVRVKKYW